MIILTKKQAKDKAYRYKLRYEKTGHAVAIEDTNYSFIASRVKGNFSSSSEFEYKSKIKNCKKCNDEFTPDKSNVLCNDCFIYDQQKRKKYGKRKLYKCVVCGSQKPENLVTDHTTDQYSGIWCDLCFRAYFEAIDAGQTMEKFLSDRSHMSCGLDQARRFGF